MANPLETETLWSEGGPAGTAIPAFNGTGDVLGLKRTSTDLDEGAGNDPDHVVEKTAATNLYLQPIVACLLDIAVKDLPDR